MSIFNQSTKNLNELVKHHYVYIGQRPSGFEKVRGFRRVKGQLQYCLNTGEYSPVTPELELNIDWTYHCQTK